MPEEKQIVMISSTAVDLPEHREQVKEACIRMDMFPVMMEHLTASDINAAGKSLAMVDRADIYVGVLAFRYGYVPDSNNPEHISITEMEYNRAVERGIPRLIFFMHKSHPITAADMDEDTTDTLEVARRKAKLDELKKRAGKERVAAFFKSATDLRGHVVQSLVEYHKPDLTAFHYVSEIPESPVAYIAHPYTLLQTHRLVGRQTELNLLTDWVTKSDEHIYQARIMNIVAIGGMGKSALTWKWFNDIAPHEMKPLAGRMWWSFYESDASFENFVTRALAYVTRRPLTEVEKIPAPDRESKLLSALDREPFLIVLDGLERLLIAYARMDAAHLSDDDYDRQPANSVANAYGLPASAAQSATGEHRLRKTADPRAGAFLLKLSAVRAARILVSTRLYPADLQMGTGESLGRCAEKSLEGLSDPDALNLWGAFGVSGSPESLLPFFNCVENHPLLIQSLASEVARYRKAPGDFDRWKHDHPDFDPFSLRLVQVKSHVLKFALCGLDDKARHALSTIAALRMPAIYDTLVALLVAKTGPSKRRPIGNECELDAVLNELEDRGLVGWDKRANRYDLHPIVRGAVWRGLDDDARRSVYTNLYKHFNALVKHIDWSEVNSFNNLIPIIESYNALIGLKRYDDAAKLFLKRLRKISFYTFSADFQIVGLVEMLFPSRLETEQAPTLSKPRILTDMLRVWAAAHRSIGNRKLAAKLYRRSNKLCERLGDWVRLNQGFLGLATTLCISGSLCDSEVATRKALQITKSQSTTGHRFWYARGIRMLGLILLVRGISADAGRLLQAATQSFTECGESHWAGATMTHLAKWKFWTGDPAGSLELAREARELVSLEHCGRCVLVSNRLEGLAALALGDSEAANRCLQVVLRRSREVAYLQEELESLVGLADLERQQNKYSAARAYLDDVWDSAERGPYPLLHADAFNVLAQIERDAGNLDEAIDAATEAYRLAWCDGPPFAYHWGLVAAQKHLQELGAAEPEMPPFDASKFEPMPEVEIDPDDEFHEGKVVEES